MSHVTGHQIATSNSLWHSNWSIDGLDPMRFMEEELPPLHWSIHQVFRLWRFIRSPMGISRWGSSRERQSMCYLLCCRRSSETEDFKRSESGPVYSVISGDSCKLSFSVCWICPQRGCGIYFSSMRSQSHDIRSRLSSEKDDEKYAQSTCILLFCEVLWKIEIQFFTWQQSNKGLGR